MRAAISGCLVVFVALTTAAQQAPLPATDVTAAEITAFIDKLPKDAISDLPIKVVDVGGYRVGVYGVFRPKSLKQDAVLHEVRTSEVYQLLDGAGTLVTGGRLVDERRDPKSTTVRGSRIEGGVSRRVVKGDVIIIPGRTPHWWSELESDIKYTIIRPDPDNRLPLRPGDSR
jgi:mannose-6-phosphate isomerase-like protein (cupin superfamily)